MLTEKDYEDAASRLGVEVEAVKAVADVESGPYGAFLATGEPVILFERHLFYRLTHGKWYNESVGEGKDARFPYRDICNKQPGGYGPVSVQHDRLNRAAQLDRDAALKSASWGKFQVLGMNWESLGYASLQEFVNAMYKDEAAHLDSFVRFVEKNGLTKALRARNWAKFAEGYNGKAYAQHSYHGKMAKAYLKHKAPTV